MKMKIIAVILGLLASGFWGYSYFLGAGNEVLKNSMAAIVESWNDAMGVTSSSFQSFPPESPPKKIPVKTSTKKPPKETAIKNKNQDSGVSSGISTSVIDPVVQPIVDASATLTTTTIQKVAPQICALANLGAPAARTIILNEIAWMGSLPQGGETSAKAANREWIELKNISSAAVDLSGWQILDSAGGIKITLSGSIPPGGFYMLVRGSDSLSGVQTDFGYSGSLPNTGDELAVFDPNCETSDFIDVSTGWPGGNNSTKQTFERDVNGMGWHTSVSPGGTPRAENSVPAPVVLANTSTPAVQYLVSVSSIGGGVGTISSTPSGILCGFTCLANFASGTKLAFTAVPAAGSLFKEWSGACAGAGTSSSCSFVATSSVSVVAQFDTIEVAPIISSTPDLTVTSSSQASSSSAPLGHLLIAAIQIGDASSSNDFVKIYNQMGVALDVSGWKLRKKSSTGTDYSLRTFSNGSAVAPGRYFTWANSAGGFSESIGADASSTETLSADNSVALFDANGKIVDQVGWGAGTNQYVEGAVYPTDPIAGQVLMRKTDSGVMVDTDINSSDFFISSSTP